MDGPSLLAGAVAGLAVGWTVAHLRARAAAAREAARAAEERAGLSAAAARVETVERERDAARERLESIGREAAAAAERLAAEREQFRRSEAEHADMERRFREAFEALSADALRRNNQAFLDLAKERLEGIQAGARQDLEERRRAIDALLEPVRQSLDRVGVTIAGVEKDRREAYGALTSTLTAMREVQEGLRGETRRLVTALRAPQVRGRWGEIQLRRVVEMAGMVEYCDFVQQATATDGEGGVLRPDLVVRLPGGKSVVVDAKTPLDAYLRAVEAAEEPDREAALRDHARQVRDHVAALARKNYWSQFRPAPEFVVMFLPGETFFSAALQQDPTLIEFGVDQKVIPASPTTLIALLRAVAYGWQQERVAEEAENIHRLGRELHDRLRTMAQHLQRVGTSLERTVKAYNDAVGSLESRVLTGARKFEEMGVGSGEPLPSLDPLESAPRRLQVRDAEEGDGAPPPASGG